MGPRSLELALNNCSTSSRIEHCSNAGSQAEDLSWWECLSEQDIDDQLYGVQTEGCAA